MQFRQTVACNACRGTGENIPPQLKCKRCNGQKLAEETCQLNVDIAKGSIEGTLFLNLQVVDGDRPEVSVSRRVTSISRASSRRRHFCSQDK